VFRALTNATPKIPRTVPKIPKSVVVQHIGEEAGKFLEVGRIFAQKNSDHQKSGLPVRQSARPKEISNGFCTTGDVIVSVPHVVATMPLHAVGHHFCSCFQGFAQIFREFVQISTDLLDFKGFSPDFHQIKTFEGSLAPCLLHQ